MEKLTLISGALFLTADIFAIIALALPFWIVTDVGGMKVELLKQSECYFVFNG